MASSNQRAVCFNRAISAFSLVSLFVFIPILHAQNELAAGISAVADPVSLPDAPTPTAIVLAGNDLRPSDFVSSSSDSNRAGQLSSHPQNTQDSQQKPSDSAPSLADLGLTNKADPDLQARLDRRSHMLKIHQQLGLYTTIPILAACISGAGAVPDRNSYGNTTSRDVHVGIAALAIGMYADTALYAIRAPRISNEPVRGGIKIHKYLIWIHAPGMILTPILGTMAFNDIASGHKPTGLAQYHQEVAVTTAIAYGASIIAVSWPIHIPFTHH